MTVQLVASLALVVPLLLLAILRHTRAFWVAGFVPAVVGFGLLVTASMVGIIAGVPLVVYGFVLLAVGAHLFKRHVTSLPPIPPARVETRAGKP
jgi:hypothetical protein